MTEIRKIASMGAMLAIAASASMANPIRMAWGLARPDPQPKKATKDRSKIKAARKQNRSRK